MKRFGFLATLMVLSSSAYAGDSYSFVFGGHRIHVEAPRHCRSLSCVAVDETRRSRDRYDDLDAAPDAAPAKPIAAAPAQPQASAPAQVQLARAPVQVAAPPAIPPVSKPSLQPVVCASPQSAIQPSEIQAPTPPAAAPVEKPLAAAPQRHQS